MTKIFGKLAVALIALPLLVLSSNTWAAGGETILDCVVSVGDITGFKIVREGAVYKLTQFRPSGATIPARNLTAQEVREKKIKMFVDHRFSPATAKATLIRQDGPNSWKGTSWFLDLHGGGGGYAHCD